MESLWKDADADVALGRMGFDHGDDLALRVYSSRLIGGNPDLVLHGGGNCSVKSSTLDLHDRPLEVIRVKATGHDLATIEASDFSALKLEGLRDLGKLDSLSDDAMLNQIRSMLLDYRAPTPSIETLLHAFLPDKFVDHTHADAALVFGNRPEGYEELRALFDVDVGLLPWIMPGFPLALAVAAFREENPDSIGLILHKHGVFSWGPDAKTSYQRMIHIVDRIENEIARRLEGTQLFADVPDYPQSSIRNAAVLIAPALRRFTAVSVKDELKPQRAMIVEWRPSTEAMAVAEDPSSCDLFWTTSPLTADHAIRTKSAYVLCNADEEELVKVIADYQMGYIEYFQEASLARESSATIVDTYPRIIIVKGAGLFALGKTKHDAIIAADIAEHTLRGKLQARALSSYEGLSPAEIFDMEYWSLQRSKLDTGEEPVLSRQIALVTGAAGAIGRAVCRILLERGAHVFMTDLPGESLDAALQEMREKFPEWQVSSAGMDVTDEALVKRGFEECLLVYGGIDTLVMNAGIAHVSSIVDMDVADWDRVHLVNETGTLLCLREAARWMKLQRMGGQIILNASKNVPSPGADFAAYSASKAGAVQLAKVAALELAEYGILVNMIHADGVFEDEASGKSSGLWDEVGPERMKKRGQSEEEMREYYKKRNLLGISVDARHVAEAVAFFAERRTPTTGAALTVDGGHLTTFYR